MQMTGNQIAHMAADSGGREVGDCAVRQNQCWFHLMGQVAKASAQLNNYGRNKRESFAQKCDAFLHLLDIFIDIEMRH
jgi:hypothetical protein